MQIPTAIISQRAYRLAYIKKPFVQSPRVATAGIGLVLSYHIRAKFKEDFCISFCDHNWQALDNYHFSSVYEALVMAELVFAVQANEWIDCHPPRSEKLYKSQSRVRRSQLEKMHRRIVGVFTDWKTSLYFVTRFNANELGYWSGIRARVQFTAVPPEE